jgi:hypothetical protein
MIRRELDPALARFARTKRRFDGTRCLPPTPLLEQALARDRLRITRDEVATSARDGHFNGSRIHRVVYGSVYAGTQENEREAAELVGIQDLMEHPGYAEATFGVICLFEEQMRLMNDLVRDQIPEELRAAHDLVVVNPDGFQGDERDVIFYSLSYDANGMTQSALSARQADREHVQGMLNVAFTRARDEMHIFHTAAIGEFGMASVKDTGLAGTLRVVWSWRRCRVRRSAVGVRSRRGAEPGCEDRRPVSGVWSRDRHRGGIARAPGGGGMRRAFRDRRCRSPGDIGARRLDGGSDSVPGLARESRGAGSACFVGAGGQGAAGAGSGCVATG